MCVYIYLSISHGFFSKIFGQTFNIITMTILIFILIFLIVNLPYQDYDSQNFINNPDTQQTMSKSGSGCVKHKRTLVVIILQSTFFKSFPTSTRYLISFTFISWIVIILMLLSVNCTINNNSCQSVVIFPSYFSPFNFIGDYSFSRCTLTFDSPFWLHYCFTSVSIFTYGFELIFAHVFLHTKIVPWFHTHIATDCEVQYVCYILYWNVLYAFHTPLSLSICFLKMLF